ncbi:MAG: hypothetical protein GTN70_06990 [Deltaproteobacteria bacterium]|nr:hypothetical protein [Deltaproteobacteria bacterium]NIS77441.1 hypothetical protein [Deltaproteobacteria bacterium]
MKNNFTATKRVYLPFLILTFLALGCAPDPLTRGSSTLASSPSPLGYIYSGEPLFLRDFTGSPVILYVRSSWCPLCKDLDRVLGKAAASGSGDVSVITLELVDRKVLDESGTSRMPYSPEGEAAFIPEPIQEKEDPLYYYGDAASVTKTLKLKRIPALIGLNRQGQVAGTLYGFQTGMDEKVKELIGLTTTEGKLVKE